MANVTGPTEQANLTSAADAPPAARVIGIAASAGGLHALIEVVSGLPATLPAAVVVLQHLAPSHRSLLTPILRERTALKVVDASDDQILQAGTVYVAPSALHTVVRGQRIYLTASPRVHFVRPSADVLFESLAIHLGRRAIAVVLTGEGLDGAHGITLIKRMGGITIVEDEATAAHRGMPHAAIQTGAVDHVVPLSEIAPTILALMDGA